MAINLKNQNILIQLCLIMLYDLVFSPFILFKEKKMIAIIRPDNIDNDVSAHK